MKISIASLLCLTSCTPVKSFNIPPPFSSSLRHLNNVHSDVRSHFRSSHHPHPPLLHNFFSTSPPSTSLLSSSSSDEEEATPQPFLPLFALLSIYVSNQWSRSLVYYMVDFSPSALPFSAMNVDLSFSQGSYGILASVGFTLLFATASLFAGAFVDRNDRRVVGVVSAAVWSLATLATGLANSYPQVLAARVITGLGESGKTRAKPRKSFYNKLTPFPSRRPYIHPFIHPLSQHALSQPQRLTLGYQTR